MCDENANQIIESNFLLRHHTKYRAIHEKYFIAQNVICPRAGRDSVQGERRCDSDHSYPWQQRGVNGQVHAPAVLPSRSKATLTPKPTEREVWWAPRLV